MGKGKQNKFKSRSVASYSREVERLDLHAKPGKKFIVISFKNFDISQGQSFENWEEDKLLSLV